MPHPLLSREILSSFFRQLPVNSRQYPLFRPFGMATNEAMDLNFDHVEDGGKVKIRVLKPPEELLFPEDVGAPTRRLSRGTVHEISVQPGFVRGHVELTDEEASMSDITIEGADGRQIDMAKSMLSRELRPTILQSAHHTLVQTLSGTAVFTMDGATKTLNYGLRSLTKPTNDWDDAANCDPRADADAMREEFADYATVEPDTVFCSNKFWKYISASNKFREQITNLEDLQKAMMEGTPFPLFGIKNWIMTEGKYGGIDRWDDDFFSVAHLGEGWESGSFTDGEPTIKAVTCRMHENGNEGGAAVWIEESKNPIMFRAHVSLNLVGVIQKEFWVQRWKIKNN